MKLQFTLVSLLAIVWGVKSQQQQLIQPDFRNQFQQQPQFQSPPPLQNFQQSQVPFQQVQQRQFQPQPQQFQQPGQQQQFQQQRPQPQFQQQPQQSAAAVNDFSSFRSSENLPTLPPVFIPPNSPQGPPPNPQSPIRNLFRQPESNNFSLSNLINRFLSIFNLNNN